MSEREESPSLGSGGLDHNSNCQLVRSRGGLYRGFHSAWSILDKTVNLVPIPPLFVVPAGGGGGWGGVCACICVLEAGIPQ